VRLKPIPVLAWPCVGMHADHGTASTLHVYGRSIKLNAKSQTQPASHGPTSFPPSYNRHLLSRTPNTHGPHYRKRYQISPADMHIDSTHVAPYFEILHLPKLTGPRAVAMLCDDCALGKSVFIFNALFYEGGSLFVVVPRLKGLLAIETGGRSHPLAAASSSFELLA
jgi:hypothetical protein